MNAAEKREYLNLCIKHGAHNATWLVASARNPSPHMRPIHVALQLIAARRLFSK